MNKRILEILTYVMKEIRNSTFEDLDLQFILDILSKQGFSEDEIAAAMSWLMNHGENIDRLIKGHPAGLPRPIWRHLNESEMDAISPNAFSYLFHLRELELLSDDNMERIIERAVTLRSSHLTVEDMQDLIAAVVLDFETSASEGYFQFTSTRLPH
jgi:uncharacterized protein Smg (DUF494 family)